MLRVHIKIVGALSRPQGKDEFDFETKEGSRLGELLKNVGYQESHLRFITTVINGTQQRLSYELKEADEVVLFLPTSGG